MNVDRDRLIVHVGSGKGTIQGPFSQVDGSTPVNVFEFHQMNVAHPFTTIKPFKKFLLSASMLSGFTTPELAGPSR